MAREWPKITISADAFEDEGSTEWPVLISLKMAYRVVCSAPEVFTPDSPRSALLGALQSGVIRATSPRLKRITRRNYVGTFTEREFDEEYISPEQWAKCAAFNPIENAMNLDTGEPRVQVSLHAVDLCHWLRVRDDPTLGPFHELTDVELAIRESIEFRRFEDVHVLSEKRMKLTKRGAPTGHEWSKAVAHVILARLHQRHDGEQDFRQADWARSLQEALGDGNGGPADSTANQYASMIIEELKYWRTRGANFG